MHFLRTTQGDGREVWVNLSLVTHIWPDSNGSTLVYQNGQTVRIQDHPEAFMECDDADETVEGDEWKTR